MIGLSLALVLVLATPQPSPLPQDEELSLIQFGMSDAAARRVFPDCKDMNGALRCVRHIRGREAILSLHSIHGKVIGYSLMAEEKTPDAALSLFQEQKEQVVNNWGQPPKIIENWSDSAHPSARGIIVAWNRLGVWLRITVRHDAPVVTVMVHDASIAPEQFTKMVHL